MAWSPRVVDRVLVSQETKITVFVHSYRYLMIYNIIIDIQLYSKIFKEKKAITIGTGFLPHPVS